MMYDKVNNNEKPKQITCIGTPAAVFTTGIVSTIAFEEAHAVNQNIGCNNNAGVNVCANVNVCAQAITIGSQQKC
jgi:hypothetical protein